MSFIMKLSLLVVQIYKDTVGFSPPLPSNLTSSLTTGVPLSLLLSFRPKFSTLWMEFLGLSLCLPSPRCRRSCRCLLMHSCCKSTTWTLMIKISSVSSLKKLWELRKKEKPKPLTVSFHLSQSNSHRGSGYGSALSRIPATDGSVWACLTVIVTSHAVSKFREELFKYRYRYIERVTGNDVLLGIISASIFYNNSQRGATYSRNRRSSKTEVRQIDISSPNSYRAQTLVVLSLYRCCLVFCLLNSFVMSFFFYWLEPAEYKQRNINIFPCWNLVPRGSSKTFHACEAQCVISCSNLTNDICK